MEKLDEGITTELLTQLYFGNTEKLTEYALMLTRCGLGEEVVSSLCWLLIAANSQREIYKVNLDD